MPKAQPRPEPALPPARPVLADHAPHFVLLEREVEIEYRPQMLAALQRKINAVAEVQQNSAKWKYLIERQNKKNPHDGEALNRQIEQEMENQEKVETQDANK